MLFAQTADGSLLVLCWFSVGSLLVLCRFSVGSVGSLLGGTRTTDDKIRKYYLAAPYARQAT